jgi:hypothetical protein
MTLTNVFFLLRQDGENDSAGTRDANFAHFQTGSPFCRASVAFLHAATGTELVYNFGWQCQNPQKCAFAP